MWDDVAAWEKLYGAPWDGLVIAANDIGAHWPRELHHWVSLHPPKFRNWEALRLRKYPVGPIAKYETWGKEQDLPVPFTEHVLKPWRRASSGLFAVQVARELNCERAILCGVPMTPTAHFKQTKEVFAPGWLQARRYWAGWLYNASYLHGWVKSMSGQTQELLGAPTLEWLVGQ